MVVSIGYITIVDVNDGTDAIVAVLSNESHTVPADNAGTVQSFAGANTTMTVFNGASDDSANWTYSVVKTNVTCSEATTSRTQTVTALSADVGYIDFTASRSGYANITKRFTITKSKAGNAGSQGTPGPTVSINPNRAATFTATDGSLDESQADIVFEATVTGITSPTYTWTFTGLQVNPTASTTASQTITAAQFGTSKSATVTCTVNPGGYKDTFTIVRLEKSTAAPYATVGATTEQAAELQSLAKSGANLVANAAFASTVGGSMAPGWALYNNGAVANVQWWYRGGGMFGTDAQRVKTLAATTNTFGVLTNFSLGGGVRYVPGWGHYISFYARAVSGEPGFAGLTMSGLANNNLWTNTQVIENPPLLNDIYQRYVFYGVANAGGDLTAGSLWITANGSKPANASLDICCVQVEAAVSGAVTAWKPGYYDVVGAGRPITTSNVTTYIANAAIDNAQIKNLAVGRAKLSPFAASDKAVVETSLVQISSSSWSDLLTVTYEATKNTITFVEVSILARPGISNNYQISSGQKFTLNAYVAELAPQIRSMQLAQIAGIFSVFGDNTLTFTDYKIETEDGPREAKLKVSTSTVSSTGGGVHTNAWIWYATMRVFTLVK